MNWISILSIAALIFVGACQTPSESRPEPGTMAANIDPNCALIVQDAAKGHAAMDLTVTKCLAIICLANPLACKPIPTPVPPGPDAGGAVSTGGASSVGGSRATGGKTATGGASPVSVGGSVPIAGAPATGGSGPTCPAVAFPSVTPTQPQQAYSAAHHPSMKWKPRRPHKVHAQASAPESSTACSVFYSANNKTPLNQGQVGSCTGNAGVKSISIAPFVGNYSETDALNYYSQATKRDNGCACTASTCSGSYPPNDTGSSGDSVYTCMQQAGILKGFTQADTFIDLMAGLNAGRVCILGANWYNSMFSPLASGQLKVTTSSGLAGGHEFVIIGHDSVNSRTWMLNSWGYWGVCFAEQITTSTPLDGTGCGYAWFADADVQKLYNSGAEGDCPTLPIKEPSNDNAFQTLSPTG